MTDINIANLLFQHLNTLTSEINRNASFLARQEIERLTEKIRSNPDRLEQYGYKVYSQCDEDGILTEIFRRLNISGGLFCEIGVENGLECNSLYLIHKGWRGVWLEGNENQKPAIESRFADLFLKKRLALGIGYVTPRNINTLLRESVKRVDASVSDLDFLSIDIDGMDIYLLEALEHTPKVICIEYNAKFPPPMSKKPVFDENYRWRGTDYMGSSLTAINEVANARGYSLVATNFAGSNAFFVRNDLLEDRFDSNLTPEHLYNPPRYYLFPGHYRYHVGHRADFGPYVDLDQAWQRR